MLCSCRNSHLALLDSLKVIVGPGDATHRHEQLGIHDTVREENVEEEVMG